MFPIKNDKMERVHTIHAFSHHFPPHLHETPEFIYVTSGTLELGINQEFYHMEKGDFAIVFPNLMHHYQVFSHGTSSAVYIYSPLNLTGQFRTSLQNYCPKCPIIPLENVHEDTIYAIRRLVEDKEMNPVIEQAYLQIILSRSMPLLELEERILKESDDTIYKTVAYIAGHFQEGLTIEKVAKDLGVTKFILSKVFSMIFHRNFNQYLNEQRLNYACAMLEYSDVPITEICTQAGFQSQRTFNRAFQEVYDMTPREYRNQYKNRYLIID